MSSHNAKTHYVIHPKKSNSHQSSLSKLCLTVMRGEHNELPSPSRAYQATTDRNDADMPPPRHVPAPACAASPTARIMSMLPCPPRLHALCHHPPHGCTHCVTVPLTAAYIALPSPSQLHAHVAVLLVLAYCLLVRFLISYFY